MKAIAPFDRWRMSIHIPQYNR